MQAGGYNIAFSGQGGLKRLENSFVVWDYLVFLKEEWGEGFFCYVRNVCGKCTVTK